MNFKDYICISENIEKGLYTDETTEGLGGFLFQLTDKFPDLQPHVKLIRKFILDSGCKKIEIKPLSIPGAKGAALSTGVIISPLLFSNTHITKEYALYVLFHEIAHQYQYKKYKSAIEQLFVDQGNEEQAIDFLKKTENVADEFSIRKCRELAKYKILDSEKIPRANYKNFSREHFAHYLNTFRDVCRRKKVTDYKKVAEIFYNFLVNGEEI
jgi:hypothetical protein